MRAKHRTVASISALLLVAGLSLTPLAAGKPTTYGAGVTTDETVALLELLAEPEKFLDKRVRVEGTVGDVCPRMGCWMDIVKGENKVRFKVKDGEMVFPIDAKGKRVVAEGVFIRVDMTEEEALSYARHMAEERGEPFDEKHAEVARSFYQIRGSGALIH